MTRHDVGTRHPDDTAARAHAHRPDREPADRDDERLTPYDWHILDGQATRPQYEPTAAELRGQLIALQQECA